MINVAKKATCGGARAGKCDARSMMLGTCPQFNGGVKREEKAKNSNF
jgi:hypothetical protein